MSAGTTGSVSWEEHQGKNVTVRAPSGSIAAASAARYLKTAEKLVAEIADMLDPPAGVARSVELYLIDPLPEIPSVLTGGDGAAPPEISEPTTGPRANGVLHLVQPEEPPSAIASGVAEFLIRQWFGPDASSAIELVVGIGALAAARAEAGPSLEESAEWVRAEVEAGRRVTLFGGGGAAEGMELIGDPGSEDAGDLEDFDEEDEDDMGGPPSAAAASFVAFLIQSSDKGSLKRFFELYSPQRRDDAAMEVFRQPLPVLEEQWLESLGIAGSPGMFQFLKFLAPLMRFEIGRYVETIVYMVIGSLFEVAFPLVTGCVIDALARSGAGPGVPEPGGICGVVAPSLSIGRLGALTGVLIVAYLLQDGLEVRRAVVEARIYNRIGLVLRERLFSHLLKLSHRFYGNARVGDIASRVSNDLDELQSGVQQVFSGGVFMLVLSTIAAVTALSKSWAIGVLILLIVPVFVVANRILGRRIARGSFEVSELFGKSADVLQESLSAQAVVKAYSLENRVMSAYVGRLNAVIRAAIRLMVTGHLYQGTIKFSTTLAQLLVLTVGGMLVVNGTISDPGTLVALMLLLPSILVPLTELAQIGQTMQSTSGSFMRVQQILDEPVDIEDKDGARDLPPIQNEITFENISFAYEPDRPILAGLDLTIPHGTNVAIVGPSGSGKSTVVNLLMRFWDPDGGRVTIDGHDLRDVTLASLRRQMGIVFQDTFVFNTTLKDNIALAREDASDEEVRAAAAAAQLDGLVESLPQGFDTVLGERGVRMSGGQRQRLAIARALLRNPPILILDEATSALDARTETEIRETIREVAKGRTTVSITHRLSIAADADLVVVLDQGRVVEQGPHNELLKAGGLYQRLYEEQTGHVTAPRPATALEAARIRAIPLFAELDMETLTELAERTMPEKFGAGEDIVRQGEPGDKLYFITRGAADVIVLEGGAERRVNTLRAGDYFGEYALLTGEERTATVRTSQPTEVYSLDKGDFTSFVEANRNLQKMLADFVNQRTAAFAAAAEAAGTFASVGER